MNTHEYAPAAQVRKALQDALDLLRNSPDDAPISIMVFDAIEQRSLHVVDMSPVAKTEDVIEGWFLLAEHEHEHDTDTCDPVCDCAGDGDALVAHMVAELRRHDWRDLADRLEAANERGDSELEATLLAAAKRLLESLKGCADVDDIGDLNPEALARIEAKADILLAQLFARNAR